MDNIIIDETFRKILFFLFLTASQCGKSFLIFLYFYSSFDFFFYDRPSDKAYEHGFINKDGVLWVGSGLLSYACDRLIDIKLII